MAYREDPTARRRERARLVSRVRELEARFTPTFWDELAADHALAPMQTWPDDAADDEVIRALADRVAKLEKLLSSWRSVERRWSRPSRALPRDLVPRGTRSRNAASRAFRELLRGRDHPFPLGVDIRVNGSPAHCLPRFFTTCARGAGAVEVEPEGMFSDLRKMLGALHEIEVGHPDFDGVFLLRGHEPTLRAVLPRPVRLAMLRLGELASRPPSLSVQRGVVELELGAVRPMETIIDLAVEILAVVREAPSRAIFRG